MSDNVDPELPKAYVVTGTLGADGVRVVVDMGPVFLPGKPEAARRYALGRALIRIGESMTEDALANPDGEQ